MDLEFDLYKKRLSEILRNARTRKGLSLTETAVLLDQCPSFVSEIESNPVHVPLSELARVISLLNLTFDEEFEFLVSPYLMKSRKA